MTPGGTSNELDVQNGWEENTHTTHINVKETFALHEVLRLLVAQYPDHLSGTISVVDLNNTTMFYAFRKDRARDERMYDLIKSLFWLQVDSGFTLKLKGVRAPQTTKPRTI